ncbi:MAG: hypothetical protein JWR23_260 [Mucilaginibacter sp.]|nr:hypothetical protein [Mucilaginibacter sp.]
MGVNVVKASYYCFDFMEGEMLLFWISYLVNLLKRNLIMTTAAIRERLNI